MSLKSLRSLALACLALVSLTAASDYDYPVNDPFAATVLGTPAAQIADYDPNFPLEIGRLGNIFERDVPDAFWYAAQLSYGYALQDGPAPIAYIISGTGGDHLESRTRLLAALLFESGAHVVTLPSPSHPNFMVAASTFVLPGDTKTDTTDLARVMQRIRDRILKHRGVTGTWLTGYSLGALNAAFLAEHDTRSGQFNFERVMLINPPISLYQSAIRLDGYLVKGIERSAGNFDTFFDQLMSDLAGLYERADLVNLDGDFLFDIYQSQDLDRDRLMALIGIVFRLTGANLLFTSDAFNKTNYVVPSNIDLGYNTSLTDYLKVSTRLSFSDYIEDLFIPSIQAREPDRSREAIIAEASLENIMPFLAQSPHIRLIHNQDDIILGPGDVERFAEVFGERATIYPNGGHLGNLFHKTLAEEIQAFFTSVPRS